MRPDIESLLSRFPRQVPVFPLPGVVLFPGALLPLHIFEERYRALLEDALEADGLMAIALLKPCSREEYESEPPFHETVCVGRIVHHETLSDGRSNIALLGLSAGRARPAASGAPYRTAHVELLEDLLDAGADFEDKLRRAFARSPSEGGLESLREQLVDFLDPDRIPAALVNTCALAAPILPFDKLGLLEERCIARRLDQLLRLLERPWQWN